MSNGAMVTCSTWAPIVVPAQSVASATSYSGRAPLFWKKHAPLCAAISNSSSPAPVGPLMKAKGNISEKDRSIAGAVGSQLGIENHEVEQDDIDDDSVEDDGSKMRLEQIRRGELSKKLSQILSNAQRLKSSTGPFYSLGIDFGDARTGVAISKGFAPRPVEVIGLKGQRLEARLIEIADQEGAVEFVVGLPKCNRGLENWQTNKTRCFAGRLAVLAAERGWRVYLHDEYGTSSDALEYMIKMLSFKPVILVLGAQKRKVDEPS